MPLHPDRVIYYSDTFKRRKDCCALGGQHSVTDNSKPGKRLVNCVSDMNCESVFIIRRKILRKLWKTSSFRSLLSGPPGGGSSREQV